MTAIPSERPAARHARRPGFVLLIAAIATIGPFSMDTFLPSLPAMSASLGATPVQAQQALSAYLLGFGIMSLWHGAISDAIGRRPVILFALLMYAVAALVCTVAPSIEMLIGARLVQGLFGGAGMIVSRAIVRDCFDGAQAQRMMSTVMLIFSVGPVAAPILGGYLHLWFGWRSVFGFMLAGALLLGAWTWRALPETLGESQRAPLAVRAMLRGYAKVLSNRQFLLLAATLAFNFSAFFVYVMATPVFLLRHLGLAETDFWLFFMPVITGMMAGSTISGRLAGHVSARRTVFAGYVLMVGGVALNLALQFTAVPGLATGRLLTFLSIAPLVISGIGQSMITPSVQVLMMDLFPDRRGMVSSCQGFSQVMLSALTAGLVAPLVSGTTRQLALTSACYCASGLAFWLLYNRARQQQTA